MLRVSYSTKMWADRCSKLEVAQEWIGPAEAQFLIQMIADLEAHQNVAEAIEFLGAEIDEAGNVMIGISRKYRASFKPIPEQSGSEAHAPDWAAVRRLILTEIVEV